MEETGKVVKELFLREKPIPGIFVNKIHPTFMILITFMLFKLSLALKNWKYPSLFYLSKTLVWI